MRSYTLLAGSLIALGSALAISSPAQAQAVCELPGAAGSENTGGSVATAPGSLACGENASATGDTAVAIGSGATAGPLAGGATLDHDGVAIGDKAKATGFHSTAIGGEAVASGAGSQAFGWKASATAAQALAVGNQAQATGANATALGNGAVASGANSVALGQGSSTAGFANSVALGSGTVNTAANQVNVGGRTIGGLANGVLLNDAVNLGQLNSALGAQDHKIGKANEGVAMALALDSPSVPAGATFAMSGGIGGYQGKHALATAISAAIGEMATVSAGFGYGLDSGEVGYRAGFQFAW
jgi:hypothetical protein